MAAAVGAGAAAGRGDQRQGGGAEAAFGRDPADIPVSAAAARAVVHLILAVGDQVAAMLRVVRETLFLDLETETGHGPIPSKRGGAGYRRSPEPAPCDGPEAMSAPQNPPFQKGKTGAQKLIRCLTTILRRTELVPGTN